MAQFQPGQGRPLNAGRKKGSKNKTKKVEEYLHDHDLKPVKEIIKLLESGDLKDRDRLQAWFELLSYCQAKPKEEVEDDCNDDEALLEQFENVSDETLLKLIKTDENA